jgi:hypothetical protein
MTQLVKRRTLFGGRGYYVVYFLLASQNTPEAIFKTSPNMNLKVLGWYPVADYPATDFGFAISAITICFPSTANHEHHIASLGKRSTEAKLHHGFDFLVFNLAHFLE